MIVITIIIVVVMIILLILTVVVVVTIAIIGTYPPKCFLLSHHVKKATLCILANTSATLRIHLALRIPRLCKRQADFISPL